MKVFKLYLFAVFFLGCTQPINEAGSVAVKADTVETDLVHEESQDITSEQRELFDSKKFHSELDSLSPIWSGFPAGYSLRIDSLTILNSYEFIQSDTAFSKSILSHSASVIKFSFNDLNETRFLPFRVIVINCTDSLKCDTLFNLLKKYATTKGNFGGFKFIPGLTYQNDFLALGKKKILWLNNSCRFGYPYHEKIIRLLLESTVNFEPKREITCKCGQVICDKQLRTTAAKR